MSAGGSTGGSTAFVWIKLATSKEDAFTRVTITASALVTDVAELSCSKFPRWRLDAGQVRIHLVAESGDEPGGKAIGAALAKKHLLVSAPVTPGAWLVAVPTTPAGGSGSGWGVEVARSSISPRSVKSLESAHSMSREAEASVAFWTLTHAAFPGAALERVQRRLLFGRRPISNRSFAATDFPVAFEAGRFAFSAATLSAEKPPAPTHGIQCIDFSGDYTKDSYGELEVDCLLKLPALIPSDWTRDPAALDPPFFIALPELQHLPERLGPNVPVQVVDEIAGSATHSRFSVEHYPDNSVMYVVGEVYAPLGSEDPLIRTVQKLRQAERTLQFLCAKEDKPVGSCVLGMVFMGPHIDKTLASKLFMSLEYYKDLLPCLWSLYQMKRLLGYHMRTVFQPAVEALLNSTAIAHLAQQQQEQQLALQQLERRLWCSLM